MLVPTLKMLQDARKAGYAVGAFNVYSLEGVRAVVTAAEAAKSPAILQILPRALELGGTALIVLCRAAAQAATVPMAVHLDHCAEAKTIASALGAGISSVMADGSHLPFAENVAFTREMAKLAHAKEAMIEAELGRLSGTEDGWSVRDRDACLTDPDQAVEFVALTGVDTLAVCIGNVHGNYSQPPKLDFRRLAQISTGLTIPLVLHATSGLPDEMVARSIPLGVCKFNVNTEVRHAAISAATQYLHSEKTPELIDLMMVQIEAMQTPILSKLRLFGAVGRWTGNE
ncbi:MAG: class II fructose-bisphosphate aldolase [Desulfosarcinaceae bacterium]|nr:class II fructose-bisphosphate aldolase [Desulfosarcinaceae bacterium]